MTASIWLAGPIDLAALDIRFVAAGAYVVGREIDAKHLRSLREARWGH